MTTSVDQVRSDPDEPIPVDRPNHQATTALRLERLAVVLASAAVLIGAAVLVGYRFDEPALVRLSPGLPPMYPNAAIGLMCGGVAVLASRRPGRRRRLAGVATVGLAAIGGVSLCLHIAGAGSTWFEALFRDDVVAPTTPVGGRPVAETCVAFLLLAGALATATLRIRPVLGQALGVAGTAVGLSAVVGYAVGVDRTSLGESLVVGMALHTGLGIALVGAAAVLARPDVGFVAQLLDGGSSSAMTRRATATVAATPLALILIGAALGRLLTSDHLAQAVFSVIQVAVLSGAVLAPAVIVTRTERQLREQLDEARRRDEHRADVDVVVEAITGEMTITVPELDGWDVAMAYQPATGHLAGDSLQVHHRRRPRAETLLAVIDIAGHDAYAAVVAYGLRAHVGALWEHGADLAEIVASVNTKLVRRRTIATGVLLAIADDDGLVAVCNAGHPPPVQLHGGHLATWPRTGPLFGLVGAGHEVHTHRVEPGDLVVVYTDGVVEARSDSGAQLGERTIHRILQARSDDVPGDVADACVDAALQHTSARLTDDALVLAMRMVPIQG